MRIKLICGAVTRTFTMVALWSFFVSVDLAIAEQSLGEELEARKCEIRVNASTRPAVSSYEDDVDFYTYNYRTTLPFGFKEGIWNNVLKIQQQLKTKNCPQQIQRYVDKFFLAALKANEKSCSNKDSRCAEYNNWAQNLYESALKNDDTIILEMLNKHSSYISKKQTQKIRKEICTNMIGICLQSAEERAKKKKAAEDAKKKAAEAAKIKAAEEKTAAIAKVKADEAAKKKAAEDAAKKKVAEEAAKKKAAKEKAAMKKADQEEAAEKQAEMVKLMDAEMGRKDAEMEKAAEEDAAQETKEDSSYILTNESLMEMFGDLPKQYQQLANIKNIKIEKLINQTKMKTINSKGITRTMYCKPCTLGSPMLQTNSTGIDMGMPKVIYDGISEALNETFGGENPLKKSQIIKLGIGCYKELAKTINDPNINKAMAMPAEQLKQIKSQQRKTQASSNKSSGGSAEGHDHDHDHEEEDWRTAPGSIYYD